MVSISRIIAHFRASRCTTYLTKEEDDNDIMVVSRLAWCERGPNDKAQRERGSWEAQWEGQYYLMSHK